MAQKNSDKSIANPTITPDIAKALEKSLELAITAVVTTEKTLEKMGKTFFSLYETLLGETSRVKWARIVETQVRVVPWTYL